MKRAIEQLKIDLSVVENNEPINRAEGKIEQAELERETAEDIRQAIQILENHGG